MPRRLANLIFASLGLGLLIAIGCTSGDGEQDGASQRADGQGDDASPESRQAGASADHQPIANNQAAQAVDAEPIVADDPDKLAGFFNPLPETTDDDNAATQGDMTNGDAATNGGTQAHTVGVTNSTTEQSGSGQSTSGQSTSDDGSANTAGDSAAASDYDPVAANGPIFEDWATPKLAIVFSGKQNGYFEPCGCAGLESMKGGTARRATFLQQRRDAGWPVVAVDLGNVVRRFGRQAEIKSNATLDALVGMQYDAIGFGPDDLALPLDHILFTVVDESRPFVSANVKIPYGVEVPTHRVFERGGLKIGVTAVLGESQTKNLRLDEITIAPAAEALAAPYQALLDEECDILLLLAFADADETEALAKQYPEFSFVSTASGAVEPPYLPRENTAIEPTIVEVGEKGMYLNVVGLFDDAQRDDAQRDDAQSVRYQRVPVDSRFNDDSEMHAILVAMQDQYKSQGWEGLGLRQVSYETGQSFVGSSKCGECHKRAFRIFEKTPHAHATETLAHLSPPRQYDPECISCHATGWEPQKYFPFAGGFDSLEATPVLTGNGCENCHGPGSDHVAIEEAAGDIDKDLRASLRESMRVTLETAKKRTCLRCHDLDNSPDYIKQGFDAYWPAVEHRGKY